MDHKAECITVNRKSNLSLAKLDKEHVFEIKKNTNIDLNENKSGRNGLKFIVFKQLKVQQIIPLDVRPGCVGQEGLCLGSPCAGALETNLFMYPPAPGDTVVTGFSTEYKIFTAFTTLYRVRYWQCQRVMWLSLRSP